MKALGARDDITVEVKPVAEVPGVSKIAASDNMIGVCSGAVFSDLL